MGNYASKLFSHHSEHEAKSKNQSVAAPCNLGLEKLKLCTPPISKRKLAADPRSATMGITRTPIEIASTPPGLTRRVASALPKYLQGKRYLETDFDTATPVTTPDKFIPDPRSPNITQQRTPIIVKSTSSYLSPVVTINEGPDMDTPVARKIAVSTRDPRSPATDFDRTPILKPRSVERIATASEEADNGIAESNVCTTRLSFCETTSDFSIPEIQAVTEIAPVLDESLSLENRIDLCAGSSGNSTSSRASSVEEISEGSEIDEQVTVIRNPKVLSPWSDALSTWTEYKAAETDVGVSEKKTNGPMVKTMDENISDIINAVMKNSIGDAKATSSNDKIKVWRDSVSPDISEEIENRKAPEEIIIDFDDEVITKTPKNVNAMKSKVEDDKTKSQTKKKKQLQQQPQQLQQLKGENKPAPDEKKVFNNDGKNPVDVVKQNRTPLGNRSNNHKQRSTAKSPQQILRNKGLSARTTHQENTPPHTDRFISKTKPNGIQWDADTTVII